VEIGIGFEYMQNPHTDFGNMGLAISNFTAVTIIHIFSKKKKFQGYVIYFKMPKSIHNNLFHP
jgi:hypothetical protein